MHGSGRRADGPRHWRSRSRPCVLKADGLAAGKGVFVCRTHDELEAALAAVEALGDAFLIEELLEGDELSRVRDLRWDASGRRSPAARDYKRAVDGDAGPNTGGMGSFSPVAAPTLDLDDLVDSIHDPVFAELARRGAPFSGCSSRD